jgi:hypothetical protein
MRFEFLLSQAQSNEIVSYEQRAMILPRAAGASYTKIRADFRLCNEEVPACWITRTVLGFHWYCAEMSG